jgi:hypothetical protein
MIEQNRLDTFFGPVGSFAGIIIFIAGIIMTFISFTAFILIVFGAFIGFSHSGTSIDIEKRRLRFANYLFGFIPLGKWVDIKSDMKIGLVFSGKTWRTFSKGNRTVDIVSKDFRMALFDKNNQVILHIKKYKNQQQATSGIQEYGNRLNLAVR